MDLGALKSRLEKNSANICIIGLGYVGLPLAIGFAKSGLNVTGFDINKERIEGLNQGRDTTKETGEELKEAIKSGLTFTSEAGEISNADFIIICVPTPITESREPDLRYIKSAAETVGKNIKKGCVIVLESTVYPGVTAEVLKPIIEEKSGMKCMEGFALGYSPERINPGDREHAVSRITKVVAGSGREASSLLKALYERVAKDVYIAENIKTAEAAKVIENIQRDLNIALMNELAIIFERMGINVYKVLEAAGTKWNFHKYYPGLVGGHCIPVDPYYLVHKAKELDYEPKVIIAGRDINNYMPAHVSSLVIRGLEKAGKKPEDSRVLLLGLSFKKNVRDLRNTPARLIIEELRKGVKEVTAYDPVMLREDASAFGINITEDLGGLSKIDCILMVTDHDAFKSLHLDLLKKISNKNPVIVDARGFFDPEEAKKAGFIYLGL